MNLTFSGSEVLGEKDFKDSSYINTCKNDFPIVAPPDPLSPNLIPAKLVFVLFSRSFHV
jgi:hypothetical protein